MTDTRIATKTLLGSSASLFAIVPTPIERARGRLMRAPDHDAGAGNGGGGNGGNAGDGADADTGADDTGAKGGQGSVDDTGGTSGGEAGGDDDTTVLGGEGDNAGDEGDQGKVVAEVPEKYELTAPEGLTLDQESIDLATPIFKELGLSNESANKLMPVAAEFANRAGAAAIAKHQIDQAQAFGAMTREWAENAKGDAEIGGANWDKTVELSGKALDMLGFPKGSEFRKLLNESGFGNHPELIRAFRRIGERISEDTFERGGGDVAKPKSDRELFYPGYTQKS